MRRILRIKIGGRVFHIPIFAVLFAVSLLLSLLILYVGAQTFYGTPHFYTVLLISVLTFILPLAGYLYIEYRRIRQMERMFPQFLRDLADAQRAGMTLPQAVVSVSKVHYGPLSEEVRKMANQISWGVPFDEALTRFAERSGSNMIKAAVRLILEAYMAGGDIASILYTVAEDSKKVHLLREERKTRFSGFIVTMYAVFLIYLVLVSILLNTLIPELPTLPQVGGESVFGISTHPTQRIEEGDMRTILFHLTIIEAVFSGIIAGLAGEGSILAGAKHAFVMILIALLAFQVLIPLPDPADRLARVILKAPPMKGASIYVGKYFVEKNITVDDIKEAMADYVSSFGLPFLKPEEKEIQFVRGKCAPCDENRVFVRPDAVIVNVPSYLTFTVQPVGGVYRVYVSG